MAKRRLLKDYISLFRNPKALFTGGPDDSGVSLTLWPNGEKEIWLKDDRGKGIRIRASRGPFGMGIQIDTFIGGGALTVMTDDASDVHLTTRHVSLCQYDGTPKAQAFRDAYLANPTDHGALDRFHAEWDGKDEWFEAKIS